MQVVLMTHRGVRCAIPIARVEAAEAAPLGAELALWEGRSVATGDARVRYLRVQTAHGLRWVAATDVCQGSVEERLDVPDLLRGGLLDGHVVALTRVAHADAGAADELVWLVDSALVGTESEVAR
jgi:hypothetical protein